MCGNGDLQGRGAGAWVDSLRFGMAASFKFETNVVNNTAWGGVDLGEGGFICVGCRYRDGQVRHIVGALLMVISGCYNSKTERTRVQEKNTSKQDLTTRYDAPLSI